MAWNPSPYTGMKAGGASVNGVRGPIPSNRSGNPPFPGYAPKYTGMVTGGASGESMANAGQTYTEANHPRTVIGSNAIKGPSNPPPGYAPKYTGMVTGGASGGSMANAGQTKPPVPLTAQQVEMQGIERAAKARMGLANSQSDMNRAAMLQDANEKSFSQGLDPNSNAAWSTRQRATDQAGLQSNQIQNQALDLNTQAMLNEQDQITQRANQEADIQSNRDWMTTEKGLDRAYQEKITASDREYQEKNIASDREYQTGINQLNAAGVQADNILKNPNNYNPETVAWAQKRFADSIGSNATGLDITDASKVIDPNSEASVNRLNMAGIAQTPENVAVMRAALDAGDDESVITRLKGGEKITLDSYNAGNAKYNSALKNPSSVSSFTPEDWSTMSQSQLEGISEAMKNSGQSTDWPGQVNAGTVLMNANIPYKVIYDPKGSSGKYMQDMQGNYFFINYKGDVQPSTEDGILNAYKKKHGGFLSGDAGTTETARKKLNLPAK